MSDVFTKAKRSEVMSRIRARDTQPELAVRSMLHGMGYRFRLHRADLPGRPDIVLVRYQTVVFVHGCFWHRHKGCRFAYTPKTRRKFWLTKFDSNTKRDHKVVVALQKLGWKVITVWECEIGYPSSLARRLQAALQAVKSGSPSTLLHRAHPARRTHTPA
jgi:DNA mismatch endonuclease (patch repair protein)